MEVVIGKGVRRGCADEFEGEGAAGLLAHFGDDVTGVGFVPPGHAEGEQAGLGEEGGDLFEALVAGEVDAHVDPTTFDSGTFGGEELEDCDEG